MDKIELYLVINNVFNRFLFFSSLSFKNLFKSYKKISFIHDEDIRKLISYYDLDIQTNVFDFNAFAFFMYKILKKEFTKSKNLNSKALEINQDFSIFLLKNEILTKEHLIFFQSDFIDFVFFHGSVGDRSYINGISDVDVVIGFNHNIVKSFISFKKNIYNLFKFNFYLFKTDPLQHHGFQSFFSFQKDIYYKHYFPDELINYGECLLGKFQTSSIRSIKHEKALLNKMIEESLATNKIYFLGNYKQKGLYSTILMIYIYKIQLKEGVFGFKPNILDLIYKNSNPIDVNILNRLTLFRSKFSYKSKIFVVLNYFEDFPLLYKYLLIIESNIRYFLSKRMLFHLGNQRLFEKILKDIYKEINE